MAEAMWLNVLSHQDSDVVGWNGGNALPTCLDGYLMMKALPVILVNSYDHILLIHPLHNGYISLLNNLKITLSYSVEAKPTILACSTP